MTDAEFQEIVFDVGAAILDRYGAVDPDDSAEYVEGYLQALFDQRKISWAEHDLLRQRFDLRWDKPWHEPLPPIDRDQECSVCQRHFDSEDRLPYFDGWVCPSCYGALHRESIEGGS